MNDFTKFYFEVPSKEPNKINREGAEDYFFQHLSKLENPYRSAPLKKENLILKIEHAVEEIDKWKINGTYKII